MNIEELEARLLAAETKLQRLEDIEAIKRLHRVYSYYVMYMLKQEIVDCFADHPEVKLRWLEGTWLGKEGVKRYFGIGDETRMKPSPLFTHQVMPIAGVIDVEGNRASGRWYAFGGVNVPREGQPSNGSFVGGIYEITYIKQDGVWKFLTVDWVINYTVRLPEGAWGTMEQMGQNIENFVGPQSDIPPSAIDPHFMTGWVLPYHYDHPVTGRPTTEKERNLKFLAERAAATKKTSRKKSPNVPG
jgi:hypothetical protein